MKKNKVFLVVVISLLAAQGCTVNVNPAVGVPAVHTHEPVVPHTGHQGTGDSGDPGERSRGTEGEAGIRGPQQPTGAEGQSGQVMGRSAGVAPPVAGSTLPHSHAEAPEPESDSAFDSEFWARVVADTLVPAVAPAIVGALFK
jgi:hypothetical protein